MNKIALMIYLYMQTRITAINMNIQVISNIF